MEIRTEFTFVWGNGADIVLDLGEPTEVGYRDHRVPTGGPYLRS
ncbi:MAG: hypothetical protein U0872_16520 [Planctomycetaceae bacterium]